MRNISEVHLLVGIHICRDAGVRFSELRNQLWIRINLIHILNQGNKPSGST